MDLKSNCRASECECDLTDAGEVLPFRYDTMKVAPFGTGFCVPTVSSDETSAV